MRHCPVASRESTLQRDTWPLPTRESRAPTWPKISACVFETQCFRGVWHLLHLLATAGSVSVPRNSGWARAGGSGAGVSLGGGFGAEALQATSRSPAKARPSTNGKRGSLGFTLKVPEPYPSLRATTNPGAI